MSLLNICTGHSHFARCVGIHDWPEIGKNVVLNILETLSDDDFVTVLTFSNETKPLVECFTDSDGEPEIVQATTENIAKLMPLYHPCSQKLIAI